MASTTEKHFTLRPSSKIGVTTTVKTDSGKEVSVRYRLFDTDNLTTSHTFDGHSAQVNDAYPAELQPRDRGRSAMVTQINDMAAHLSPADLADSRNLNQGAPIVRRDGVVLNGNGRTMAIMAAQNRNNQAAKSEELSKIPCRQCRKIWLYP